MKNLYMIGGPMGVGKTTVALILKKQLDNCVYLDGDWCWDADPFVVTDATKEMVTDNICHLLNNFIKTGRYENIVFTWVMHTDDIINGILRRLDTGGVNIKTISLLASPDELTRRLQKDIQDDKRQPDVIERSLDRLKSFDGVNSIKIDVTHLTPEKTANIIKKC